MRSVFLLKVRKEVWGEGFTTIRDWDETKVQCPLLAHIYTAFSVLMFCQGKCTSDPERIEQTASRVTKSFKERMLRIIGTIFVKLHGSP